MIDAQIGYVYSHNDITYRVQWADKDLAYLERNGDIVIEFASIHAGGFINESDVFDQAQDVALNIDDDDILDDEYEEADCG